MVSLNLMKKSVGSLLSKKNALQVRGTNKRMSVLKFILSKCMTVLP